MYAKSGFVAGTATTADAVSCEPTVVTALGLTIGGKSIAMIAGPCSVESREQIISIAKKLKALGADHLINYKEHANWGEVANKLAGARGVDAVVEIGGAGTMAQSIQACRIGGHISLIGVLAGVSGEVPTALAMSKNVAIKGITVGSIEDQDDMIAALEANGVKPVIDSVYPLDQIAAAFAHQLSQKHFGKICLDI